MKSPTKLNLKAKLQSGFKNVFAESLGIERSFTQKLESFLINVSVESNKSLEAISLKFSPEDLRSYVCFQNEILKGMSPHEFLNMINIPNFLHPSIVYQTNNCISEISKKYKIPQEGLTLEFSIRAKCLVIKLYSKQEFIIEMPPQDLVRFFI